MKTTVKGFLLIILICGFVSTCNKKNDITIYRVVAPPKPPFDAEKYNLVDTSKSFVELRTQAYKTDDVNERIQIFDYLLEYHPREADIGEFYKTYYMSERTDWYGTPQMELITNTISQNQYTAVKERCLYYLTWYYIASTQVDSVIMWMDSLQTLCPRSRLFNQGQYDLLVETSDAIQKIKSGMIAGRPEMLWKMGHAYWRLATLGWKSPFYPFKKVAQAFFDTLKTEHPLSSFNANVEYVMLSEKFDVEIHEDAHVEYALLLAGQLEQILKQYPNTDIRHEVMVRMAFNYLIVWYLMKETQPDTAFFYCRKGDSLYGLINFKYLETEQVDDNLKHIIRGTHDYMKRYQEFIDGQK